MCLTLNKSIVLYITFSLLTIFLYSFLLNLWTEVCLWCWPWTFRVFHLSYYTKEYLVQLVECRSKVDQSVSCGLIIFFLDFIFLKLRLKLRYCATSIYLLKRAGRESGGERKRVRDLILWTFESIYTRREYDWLLDHWMSHYFLSSCNPSFRSFQSPEFLFFFFLLFYLR